MSSQRLAPRGLHRPSMGQQWRRIFAHRRLCRFVAAWMALLSVGAMAGAAITVDIAPGATIRVGPIDHWCWPDAVDWCQTRNFLWQALDSPDAGHPFRDTLHAAFDKWTVSYSNDLKGKILIQNYVPHLCDGYGDAIDDYLPPGWRIPDPIDPYRQDETHCTHGATMQMVFVPDPTGWGIDLKPGEQLHWIQRAFLTGRGCGYTQKYQARDFIDCTPGGGPYYYEAAEEGRIADSGLPQYWFRDSPEAGCWREDRDRNGAHDFCGYSGGGCPAPCNWAVQFQTYLVKGTRPSAPDFTRTMTVYGGIYWGFKALCRPENSNPECPEKPKARDARSPEVRYDPATRTLSFSDGNIDTLNLDGSDASEPSFALDPMMGATVSISEFSYYDQSEDGYLFQGGRLRIHKGGVDFLTADIPWLWVDDEAAAEFGDNLYGRFTNLTYDLSSGSAWLAAYMQAYEGYATGYQEFRASTSGPLEASIAADLPALVTASIAASGCETPEPASFLLLACGLPAVLLRRRRP